MAVKKVKVKLNGAKKVFEDKWSAFLDNIKRLPLNVQLVELYNFLDGAAKTVRLVVIERIKEVESEIAREASFFFKHRGYC